MRSAVAGENSHRAKLRYPRARGSDVCAWLRMRSHMRPMDDLPTSSPGCKRFEVTHESYKLVFPNIAFPVSSSAGATSLQYSMASTVLVSVTNTEDVRRP